MDQNRYWHSGTVSKAAFGALNCWQPLWHQRECTLTMLLMKLMKYFRHTECIKIIHKTTRHDLLRNKTLTTQVNILMYSSPDSSASLGGTHHPSLHDGVSCLVFQMRRRHREVGNQRNFTFRTNGSHGRPSASFQGETVHC